MVLHQCHGHGEIKSIWYPVHCHDSIVGKRSSRNRKQDYYKCVFFEKSLVQRSLQFPSWTTCTLPRWTPLATVHRLPSNEEMEKYLVNTSYPPDTLCFAARQLYLDEKFNCTASNFTITNNMLMFLNLTSDENLYRQAYCVAPPSDDNCAFGYCPNPDIAGPLVRIATYVTNICLSILVFYSPKGAKEAYWSQILSIYSVLFTCSISIFQVELTRYHATLAVVLTGSPLSVYLFIYSIMSFWYRKHRMNGILGDGQMLPRILIIIAGGIWTAILSYVLSSAHVSHFAQESCSGQVPLDKSLYLYPFVLLKVLRQTPILFLPIVGILLLILLSWIIGIILQRKAIWPHDEPWRPRFGRTWSVMGRNYPFIHFVSVVAVPTIYWLLIVELSCLMARSDNEFSLSFGQVMATFVALPPLIQTCLLSPRFVRWFIDLTWVRACCCRRRKRVEKDDPVAFEPVVDSEIEEEVKSDFATANLYKEQRSPVLH
ncbi:hypothetical protein QCA50_005313 [Cerrena zonata]|uniref:G-protein coupled receptors family 2 profile 2 domain-containing protein n=1 Tax=Cerrena zonata TaxID=2478898 RepID=A0AAW0GNU4_9APHY